MYKSNSCVARRWPVLHLANEKSVPFDVAPTRVWWESLLYRPLLHPSSFTERGPPFPPRPSCVSFAVLPSPALRERALFLHSAVIHFLYRPFYQFSDADLYKSYNKKKLGSFSIWIFFINLIYTLAIFTNLNFELQR